VEAMLEEMNWAIALELYKAHPIAALFDLQDSRAPNTMKVYEIKT
jgi:hypothetical protein